MKEKVRRLLFIVVSVFVALGLLYSTFGCSPPKKEVGIDILKDAGWLLQHKLPTTITWVNRNGGTVQSWAISGDVEIIVDPSKSQYEVLSLAAENGGLIFAQLPTLGLYWAHVVAGQEAIFIENVRPSVIDVLPNIILQTTQYPLPTDYTYKAGQTNPFPVTSGNLMIDNFSGPMEPVGYGKDANGRIYPIYIKANSDGSPAVKTDVNGEKKFIEIRDPPMVPWVDEKGITFVDETGKVIMIPDVTKVAVASHGAVVNYYRTCENQLTEQTLGAKSSMDILSKDAPASDSILGIAALIQGAQQKTFKSVINVSLGPVEYSGNKNDEDYNPGWQPYNSSNYGSYTDSLTAMLNSDVAGAKDAIIVLAAGNSSTDLSSMLVNKLSIDPISNMQIIPVGALDASGNIASYSNYSTVPETMIYVPVTGKTESGLDVGGTSFAAPQLQYLIAQILKARPDLTPEQLHQVLFGVAPLQSVQLPNAPIGEKINIHQILAPYDEKTLTNALNITVTLFPAKKSNTIQSGGGKTGNQTASANNVTIFPKQSTVDLDFPNLLLYANVDSIHVKAPSDEKYNVGWYLNNKLISSESNLTTAPFLKAIGNREGTYAIKLVVWDKAGTQLGYYTASVIAKKQKPILVPTNHWVSTTPGKGMRCVNFVNGENFDWWEDDVDLRLDGSTGTFTTTLTACSWPTEWSTIGQKFVSAIENLKDNGTTIDFNLDEHTTVHLTRAADGHLTGSYYSYDPGAVISGIERLPSEVKGTLDLKPAP